jgi:uncharacterized repeat protein (TIGR01451 family)/CSLREA domain-containing protein
MRQRTVRRGRLAFLRSERKRLARLGALLAAGATAGGAQAATITVNALGDTVATNGQCTLREALNNANGNADTTAGDCTAGSGPDIVAFQPGLTGTITLGGSQLVVSDSVSINGPGAGVLSVSGNNASRIFYVYNNSQNLVVTISGLTLTQGNNLAGGSAVNIKGESVTLSAVTVSGNTGDAVNVTEGPPISDGSLTLQSSTVTGTTAGRGIRGIRFFEATITDSTISGNSTTGKGAGLFLYRASGAIVIDNSTISGNTTANRGGGLMLYANNSTITITNSQITGNTAGNRGGGINLYKAGSRVTIQNTTISGNTSNNRGGGIFFYNQPTGTTELTISNSTISGNSAGSTFGGGIFFYKQAGTTVIENSTISGNSAADGGGLCDFAILGTAALVIRNSTISGNSASTSGGNARLTSFPAVTVVNSIIANGTAPAQPDLGTGPTNFSVNYSLIENTTGATFTGANNVTGVDPQLGALANNGGATQTHLPAVTSPVLNAGDPGFAPPPSTDQRGLARVTASRVDIGSLELNGGTIELASVTASVNEGGGSITITLNRTGGTDPATVNYTTSNGSAIEPGDYTLTSGTASFAAGASSTSFIVPILDDPTVEGDETFNITISAPSAIATLGAQSSEVVTIVDNDLTPADLAITKSAGTGPFVVGLPMTFNIGVSNAGPGPASAVDVSDVLPAGTTFVSATPSQGSCSGTTTVTCALGTIASGGSATVALVVTPTAPGPLSNTASVTGTPEPDPNSQNNAATAAASVDPAPAIPLLGGLGKAILAFSLALVGLFVIRKQQG